LRLPAKMTNACAEFSSKQAVLKEQLLQYLPASQILEVSLGPGAASEIFKEKRKSQC